MPASMLRESASQTCRTDRKSNKHGKTSHFYRQNEGVFLANLHEMCTVQTYERYSKGREDQAKDEGYLAKKGFFAS